MRKRISSLFVIILCFAFFSFSPALANPPLILNFRDIKAFEKSIVSLSFSLPVYNTQTLSFDCSSPVDLSTGKTIPQERITFTYQQQTVSVNQPLQLTTNNLGQDSVVCGKTADFLINIEFNPSDLPGEYQGYIYAVYQDSTGNSERIPIFLKINLLPWIRFKTATPNPKIIFNHIPSLTGIGLQTTEPIRILLASNAPWCLFLRFGEKRIFERSSFPIEVSISKSSKDKSFKESFFPNEGFKLVASGSPTISGDGSEPEKYWTELWFSASILDWHLYPTGTHSLVIYLSGQTNE